ncbi:MAG: peptide-methionine (S)-S-oxide reductase MsrA [Proteobacteria bacterium]|jgi:peptide methionine sulfoxide reductase msrA/msrB|nr:peptide-methionine (S)-S-oxide reductase MsrA [Pseudomonadota bacterium]
MKKTLVIFAVLLLSTLAFAGKKQKSVEAPKQQLKMEVATFAMGCFWCVQPVFDKMDGVIQTQVGFSGGDEKNVDYANVSSGKTGHAEAIEVTYDPKKVTFEKLLEKYWSNIDPTDGTGQFVDRGAQYRPAIFYHTEDQKKSAEESKKRLEVSKKFEKPIAVEIVPYKFFVPVRGEDAEKHDKYYQKNPFGYDLYKKGSGREKILKELNK